MRTILQPANHIIQQALGTAFAEDWGLAGDVTSQACIAPNTQAVAQLRLRGQLNKHYVISGLELAKAAFLYDNSSLQVELYQQDGAVVPANTVLAKISGLALPLLSRERVALNYLCHLSGIASMTQEYVQAVARNQTLITDTRKTNPGLRALEKFAVRCGGGCNHRFGLFDAIMIKDNHIAVAGGIVPALQAARKNASHMLAVELELDSLEQLYQIDFAHRDSSPDCILLDNMSLLDMRAAVQYIAKRAQVEASGGIRLEQVAQIAQTGVDFISIGALTHSAAILDIGLDFL